MQDSIIQEVEDTRERLARRFDYDVKEIAAYLRQRAKERRAAQDNGGSRADASSKRSA
jgi:hypothetical protein